MTGPSRRWVVLSTGVLAQATSAGVLQGLPALAPALRSEYGLSLVGLGLVLAAATLGLVATLLLWGAAADRVGERWVMTVGLLGLAGALVLAAGSGTPRGLAAALLLAGAAGASVNAASGRAVMGWFPAPQRGFAMGIRQTALPLGAGLAAAVLPSVAAAGGLSAAFLLQAAVAVAAAAAVLIGIREAPGQRAASVAARAAGGASPVRDPRLQRLALASALLVMTQFGVVAFLVVFLSEEHGVDVQVAALLLAAVQLLGGAGRLAAGRWSDRVGSRLRPVARITQAVLLAYLVLALVARGPVEVLIPVIVLTGAVAISWNGLAFVAAAELAGAGKAGTALGFQNTAVAIGVVVTPPLLALLVEVAGWTAAFLAVAVVPVLVLGLLRPLVAHEDGVREEVREAAADLRSAPEV